MIVVPELRELLDRIDPTPDSGDDSGVTDWADLDDRVHFIADMFRCFQESRFLFDPPFSPVQLERLGQGSGRPIRSDGPGGDRTSSITIPRWPPTAPIDLSRGHSERP